MRGTQVLTAVIIGVAAVLSGCGQRHPGTGAAAAPSSSASAPPSGVAAAPRCPGGQPAWHAGTLTITAADNYKSFCVTRGTIVTVLLKGTAARKWAPIHASPAVLVPHASGELALAIGVTGASFLAARPGTAVITSSRPACGPGVPPGNSATGTGTFSCDAIIAFQVAVTVVHLRDQGTIRQPFCI
jgi:hypothetical protein